MPDVVLKIDDVEFLGAEIPPSIRVAISQKIGVHRFIGGSRDLHAMGPDHDPVAWSGHFLFERGRSRAQYLKQMCADGKPHTLTWDSQRYTIVIESFSYEWSYASSPYSISCVVHEDQSIKVTDGYYESIRLAIEADMNAANALGTEIDAEVVVDETGVQIDNGGLSQLLGTLDNAIKTVSDFAKATQNQINSVLRPLAEVQKRVTILIGQTSGVINQVTTLGRILPNNPLSRYANRVMSGAFALTHSAKLYELQSVLNRMGGNLGNLSQSGMTVTTSDSSLERIASKYYGDPSAVIGIMEANGITDTLLTGINKLKIPATPNSTVSI